MFVDWHNSSPETRGYLSSSSDIVALLVFDHQMHAINLLTRLNWESRVASSDGYVSVSDGALGRLVNELADYLLFVERSATLRAAAPRPGFAERLESRTPKDRHGRSFGQLDAVNRLLRYPCSYMVYSEGVRRIVAGGERGGVPPDARRIVGERRTPEVRTSSRLKIVVPSSRF